MRELSVHDFPLAGKVDYLNTAGIGLIPRPVVRQLQEFSERHFSKPPYEEAFYQGLEMVEVARRLFAKFINCTADELSFQTNSSMAVSLLSEIIPWKSGDEVLIDDLQFPSDIYPWMNLRAQGVKLKVIKSHRGAVEVDDYKRSMDKRTKLVSVSLVSYVNGFTHDVVSLGELAKEHGAYLLVDATHGAGYLNIDVRKWQADFLVTSNYKWLLSPFGAAELYLRKDVILQTPSPHVGWFSISDYLDASARFDHYEPAPCARKFEPGNHDYASIFGLQKSLLYMGKIGFRRIHEETRKLHQRLTDGLLTLGIELLTPTNTRNWSALVFCRIPKVKGVRLAELLRKRRIHVTPRVFKDFDGIRISPYFYNSKKDIDYLLEELKRIQGMYS